MIFEDISPNFIWNPVDAKIAEKLIELDKTPEAIRYFSRVCNQLTDYSYWFFLSTLWVSYSGYSDLNLWKSLFSSNRPNKKTSIMKPSEMQAFDRLPGIVKAYRAHRPGETDWISYTTDIEIAFRFARERKVDKVTQYMIPKGYITALFLRRGEKEIIVLDHRWAKKVCDISERCGEDVKESNT